MENEQQKPSFNLGSILHPIEDGRNNNFSTSAEIRLDQCVGFFLKGKRALDNKDLDTALKLLEQAILSLRPEDLKIKDNSIYFSYLGSAMLKKGWTSFAQAKFKEALKIDPTDSMALDGLKSITSIEKNNVHLNDKKHDKKHAKIDNKVTRLKSFFARFIKFK